MADELNQIREITNNEPAPEAAAPPEMRCPACGIVLERNGAHPEGKACIAEGQDGCPND